MAQNSVLLGSQVEVEVEVEVKVGAYNKSQPPGPLSAPLVPQGSVRLRSCGRNSTRITSYHHVVSTASMARARAAGLPY